LAALSQGGAAELALGAAPLVPGLGSGDSQHVTHKGRPDGPGVLSCARGVTSLTLLSLLRLVCSGGGFALRILVVL